MKKPLIWWIIAVGASALVMLALPLLLPQNLGLDTANVFFLVWYVVNPVFCVAAGIFAGWHILQMWPFPAVPPVMFILGVWLTLGTPISTTFTQAFSYLGFGVIAMLVVGLFRYRSAHRNDRR